jgi:hypothetical protein
MGKTSVPTIHRALAQMDMSGRARICTMYQTQTMAIVATAKTRTAYAIGDMLEPSPRATGPGDGCLLEEAEPGARWLGAWPVADLFDGRAFAGSSRISAVPARAASQGRSNAPEACERSGAARQQWKWKQGNQAAKAGPGYDTGLDGGGPPHGRTSVVLGSRS